jgi:hypothetical protein
VAELLEPPGTTIPARCRADRRRALAPQQMGQTVGWLYTQTVDHVAQLALDGAPLDQLRSPSFVLHSSAALVILVTATVLGIFKPRALTPYGARRRTDAESVAATSSFDSVLGQGVGDGHPAVASSPWSSSWRSNQAWMATTSCGSSVVYVSSAPSGVSTYVTAMSA